MCFMVVFNCKPQSLNLRVEIFLLYNRDVMGKGRLVTGIKKGTYLNEHWVLSTNNEARNTTSETNEVLYGD